MVVYLIVNMISMMFRGQEFDGHPLDSLIFFCERQVTHGLMQGAISAPRSLRRCGWKNSRDIL